MKYYILNKTTGKTKTMDTNSPLFLKKYIGSMWYVTRADGKQFDEEERRVLGMKPSYVKDNAVWIDAQLKTSFTVEDLVISISERNKIEYKKVFDFVTRNIDNLSQFDVESAYAIACKALCGTE